MQILTVPILQDNYSYIINNNKQAIVVDPGESLPIIEVLKLNQLELAGILITHHHYDHNDGVKSLLQSTKADIVIYATTAKATYINWQDITNLSTIELNCLNSPIEIITAPGHTNDHVMFKLENNLFVGDVLFGAGAGKLFEGSAETFSATYNNFAKISEEMLIYFGHEYTTTNLNFAIDIEPYNQATATRLKQLKTPSTPSTLEIEKATNPFLRGNQSALQEEVNKRLKLATLEEKLMPYYVRQCKDEWDALNSC